MDSIVSRDRYHLHRRHQEPHIDLFLEKCGCWWCELGCSLTSRDFNIDGYQTISIEKNNWRDDHPKGIDK